MIRRWRRALAFIFASSLQGHRDIFTAVAGLELVQGLASPAAAIGLKTLTNGVIASRSSAMLAGAMVLAGVVAAQWAAAGASFRLRLALRERTHFVLSQRLAALTSRNPGVEAFEDAEVANRIELARRGLPLAAQGGGTITATAGILIQFGITLVLLFSAHPALTLLPLLGYPTVLAGLRSQQRLKAAEERSAQDLRLARHIAEVATSTGPAKEIRVFGLQDLLVERQQAAWNRAHASRMEAVWSSATAQALSGAVFALGLAGAVLLTATAAVRGRASAGDVLLVLFLAQQLQGNLTTMRARLIRITDIVNAAERILSIEHAAPACTPAPRSEPSPVPSALGKGITLEGVGFRYPNAEHWAVRDVDLTLQPGMVLALVGENGAGKTTLVKLLLRLYEPTEGRILIDGTDITAVDAAEWQGATSAAFQDFSRWEFLARDAVGIGDVARVDALEAVEHALARAGARSLAEQLPRGLQTQLGSSWTGGIDLSEGQWQKVAIGRVLMRASPLLVVLDEPTASLDALTEHALFRHYAEIAREDPGRVTVLVSHRFSTVRMADLIVVLAGGRVIERGTHEDLMRMGGTYAALFETQLEGYRA